MACSIEKQAFERCVVHWRPEEAALVEPAQVRLVPDADGDAIRLAGPDERGDVEIEAVRMPSAPVLMVAGIVAVDPQPGLVHCAAAPEVDGLILEPLRDHERPPIPAVARVAVPLLVLGLVLYITDEVRVPGAPGRVIEFRCIPFADHTFVEGIARIAHLQRQWCHERAPRSVHHRSQLLVLALASGSKVG